MKTNILIVLDTRVKKADGTFPLIMRIIHNRKSSQIPLNLSLNPKDWNDEGSKIKSSYKDTESVGRLNAKIQKKKVEALEIISDLDKAKTLNSFTVLQLKELIEKKNVNYSFFTYWESVIKELEQANKIGNARTYQSVLGIIKGYCKQKDLQFNEMNHDFLKKFEIAHLAKGNTYNSLSVYFRTIRAVYNRAIKDKIADKSTYPFENVSIKSSKTRKLAISMDVIGKIEKLNIEPSSSLYETRLYFMFSFYCRGMSFADVAQLKLSNVINGRIFYQRMKTDKPYDIKITPQIQKILDLYVQDKKQEDFIFPIIKRTDLKEQYRDIEWARNRYNKRLRDIGLVCGVTENMTSKVSRHSFATQAKNLGVPITAISDMLGHESTKTTEIYLDSLPSDIMDDFHEKIISTSSKKQPTNKTKKK